MINKYRIIRAATGRTQAEMARAVGLSLRTIKVVEKENAVTDQTIAKYAAATGIHKATLQQIDLRGLTYVEAIHYISSLMIESKKNKRRSIS